MNTKFSGLPALLVGLVTLTSLLWPDEASAIPAFARKYSLRCSACHESWPQLNDFGRSFRDNGYQLRLGKDNTINSSPGYFPLSVRITPTYQYTSVSNVATDQGVKTLKSGGIADAGIDLLMAGVLTDNISFIVVPTGFASDGVANLESYWAYFSRPLLNSDWLNLRIGKFELDLPSSSHRPFGLSSDYLVYGYHGDPADNLAGSFSIGENQRGIEVLGHNRDSSARYAFAIYSANDSPGSQHALDSPSFYLHVQKYFRPTSGAVSQFALGAWGASAQYPTQFLTDGGEPIPGGGTALRTTTRYGLEGQAWFGELATPVHLTLVLAQGSDDRELFQGAADQSAKWNGGYLEGVWVPARQLLHWGVYGRYDWIKNTTQPSAAAPSNLGDQTQFTLGTRYTYAYSIRDEVAFHLEFRC